MSDSQSRRAVQQLTGPCDSNFSCIAFNPNGKTLSACEKEKIVTWDIATGKRVGCIQRSNALFHTITYSSNGDYLAVGCRDGRIIIWSEKTKKQINKIEHHHEAVSSLLFTRDSKQLISAGWDGNIFIWDILDTSPHVDGHTGPLTCMAIHPNSKVLGTGSADKKCILWSLPTRKQQKTLVHTDCVSALDFSPSGKFLATAQYSEWGSKKLPITVWEVATGKKWCEFPGHWKSWNVAFSPNGNEIASVGEDGHPYFTICVWNLTTRKRTKTIRVSNKEISTIHSFEFSPDGQSLLLSSDHGVMIWESKSGKPRFTIKLNQNLGKCCNATMISRTRFVLITEKGIVQFWNLQTKRCDYTQTLKGKRLLPASVYPFLSRCWFSSNKRMLVGLRGNYGVVTWEVITGQTRFEICKPKFNPMVGGVLMRSIENIITYHPLSSRITVWDISPTRR